MPSLNPNRVGQFSMEIPGQFCVEINTFGDTAPVQDPDGDGIAFVFDMRFPGQRYDSASGMNYNYFRDYDPATGRYLESDPIGLDGGISTFGYVESNPVISADFFGLANLILLRPRQAGRTFARNVNPPGVYSVVAHANPDGVRDSVSGKMLTAHELAERIRSDKKHYRPGMTVVLFACRTGQKDYAQQLADELQAKVRAPNQYLFGYDDGHYIFAGKNDPDNGLPDRKNIGRLIDFTPKPKE